MTGPWTTPFGDFGAPPDAVAWVALLLGVLLAGLGAARGHPSVLALARLSPVWPLHGRERRGFLLATGLLAVAAFALSAGYVVHYLRGGPRIIDATSYLLEARGFASGHVTFGVPEPSGSFRGRFLLSTDEGRSLAVIFPPGYPAVLALGVLAGAPMIVGPFLAAGLVVATAALSLRLFSDARAALLAAALSAVCAVLRYHTADTMSHGWAGLLLAASLWASLGARLPSACLAGASAGLLVSTRPLSGVVALALIACVLASRPRHLAAAALASLPPLALFLAQQRLATGVWFGSTQLAYYALADGPPGCFRYGFGAGIGCQFEHGDFVNAHLREGYGAFAAAGTTLRRLKMHLADAANGEVFAALLVAALVAALRTGKGRLAALGIVGIVGVYVPFYFDGNFPGGGARFFADALPLEHVLLAATCFRLRLARVALPLALTGFALHTSYDHLRLAEREGGRPLFEPAVLAAAGVSRGLVFVETDHGFSLGHAPGVGDAARGIVVARRRHDAHDGILWQRLGRPPAYSYDVDASRSSSIPQILPLSLPEMVWWRFEAEAEWPPLAVNGGSARPVFPPCASGHRALSIEPASGSPEATVRLEVTAPGPGTYRLFTGWVAGAGGVRAVVAHEGLRYDVAAEGPTGACVVRSGPLIRVVDTAKASVMIDVIVGSPQAVDFLELRPADAEGPAPAD